MKRAVRVECWHTASNRAAHRYICRLYISLHRHYKTRYKNTQTWDSHVFGDKNICLLFVSDSGTLKVYVRSGPSEPDLMFHGSSSGGSWRRFSQSVETIQPFQVTGIVWWWLKKESHLWHSLIFCTTHSQLLIEAQSNNRGFVAVDDISVTAGLCRGTDIL